MNFKLELDLKDFIRGLDEAARKRIPAALASGLNHTANGSRKMLQKEMDDIFRPKPTPYIRNSVRVQTADPKDLTAWVYISDVKSREKALSPLEILRPHVFGGDRAIKASEARLRRIGYMGQGQYVVPGIGASRDSYGNISSGQMQKILGWVKAYREKGYSKTQKTNHHYVKPFIGVFKYIGAGQSVPVLFFTYQKPQYEQSFDFNSLMVDFVKKNLLKNIAQAWGVSMLKKGYSGH